MSFLCSPLSHPVGHISHMRPGCAREAWRRGEPRQGASAWPGLWGRGRLVFAVSPVTPVDLSAVLVEHMAGLESRPVPSPTEVTCSLQNALVLPCC